MNPLEIAVEVMALCVLGYAACSGVRDAVNDAIDEWRTTGAGD